MADEVKASSDIGYQNYSAEGRENHFSVMRPEEEWIQPVPEGAHYEWTETSMFGFNIPEHGIDCIIYYWHHPALSVTYGGLIIWRGQNSNQVACDYSDYRSVMPLPDDITNCTYANGVTVKMIKPLEEFHITFDDPVYETSLDLRLKAIMPPACRYNGGHITQAMKTSGELVLSGERFKIDGYHTRDRSWNEARSEVIRKTPPLNWTVGVFDDDFAFHHCSFDNRRYHPEWGDRFPGNGDDNNCLWGYIYENGETHGVAHVDQQTTRGPDGIAPMAVRTVITATNGRDYVITGKAISSTPVMAWPNMAAHFVLFEWECEGRKAKGHGDIQMVIYRDAYRMMDKVAPKE
nr:hypothetical protein [Sphingomonas sp. CDS-1]